MHLSLISQHLQDRRAVHLHWDLQKVSAMRNDLLLTLNSFGLFCGKKPFSNKIGHNSTSKGSKGQKFTWNLSFFTSLQFGESYMPFSFSISVIIMGLKMSLLEILKSRIICKRETQDPSTEQPALSVCQRGTIFHHPLWQCKNWKDWRNALDCSIGTSLNCWTVEKGATPALPRTWVLE